jgi:hypothetical protein
MQTREFEDALADSHERPKTCRHYVRRSGAVALPPLSVADALGVQGVPVVEILSESSHRRHKLTPFAQVEGTQITYPSEQTTLL